MAKQRKIIKNNIIFYLKGESVKVLMLNIRFKLSDDFNGDSIDALKEYLEYQKNNKLSTTSERDYVVAYDTSTNYKNFILKLWDNFSIAIKRGFKFYGKVYLGEWNPETKKWKEIGMG